MRIQSDRGHTVATNGPYRIIRHPAYVGMILFEIAMSILSDSWWSLLAGRILLHTPDRPAYCPGGWNISKKELPGYDQYARQVRFRLLPGIW